MKQADKPTVITGVIGGDIHTIGNWILSRALEEAGFKVANLGPMVSQQEFLDAAKETNASAILISSVYGMAALDCEGFKARCQEAGLGNVLLYIGGQLTTSQEDWPEIEQIFKDLGFDRVYPPGTSPETGIADLRKDLGLQTGG